MHLVDTAEIKSVANGPCCVHQCAHDRSKVKFHILPPSQRTLVRGLFNPPDDDNIFSCPSSSHPILDFTEQTVLSLCDEHDKEFKAQLEIRYHH